MIPFLAQQTPPEDDIEGIIVLAPEASPWPWIAGGLAALLVLALLGVLLWFVLSRLLGKPRPISPLATARRGLRDIESEKAGLSPNDASLRISEVLKDFLQESFADPLRFETAQEFLARHARPGTTRLPQAAHQDLRSFVTMSEELKFGHPPDAERKVDSLLQLARNVLDLTEASVPAPEGKDAEMSVASRADAEKFQA